MKVRTNEQRRNTYNFLMEIYEMCNDDYFKFSINEIVGKHKIARGTATTLIRNKYISKKNLGKGVMYKWQSIRPNYKMVEKILDLNLEYTRMYTEARKDKITSEYNINKEFIISDTPVVFTPKTRKKKVVEVEKKQKSFSLFWGLIKINY